MRRKRSALRFHAVYAVVNDAVMFECSVRSIYERVSRITVVTNLDRDWHGAPVDRDDLLERVLSRAFDPDRKIDVVVSSETNEARARNAPMDLAAGVSRRVRSAHVGDVVEPAADFFWIVDADEVYEAAAVESLQAFVAQRRRPAYRVPFWTYFKSWNYRVQAIGWATTFLRADQRVFAIRNPRTPLRSKIAYRIPGISYEGVHRIGGNVQIPLDVGCFHHGSYIGDERVLRKVTAGGHRDHVIPGWIDDVWRRWTPASRDFHPTDPELFPSVEYVPTDQLPSEIASFPWPSGCLGTVESPSAVGG